jgi:hypothetical protein
MKQRLPRKHKKQVKKKVNALIVSRTVQSAIVSASSMAQLACISATPNSIGEKALATVGIVHDTASKIVQIMSEKPNHWRDFLR